MDRKIDLFHNILRKPADEERLEPKRKSVRTIFTSEPLDPSNLGYYLVRLYVRTEPESETSKISHIAYRIPGIGVPEIIKDAKDKTTDFRNQPFAFELAIHVKYFKVCRL